MKRLLLAMLVITFGLMGTWAAAEPTDAPIPESNSAPEKEEPAVDDFHSERTEPAEPLPEDLSSEQDGESCHVPEVVPVQYASCTYTCFVSPVCPRFRDLPLPTCVNGCCVYGEE